MFWSMSLREFCTLQSGQFGDFCSHVWWTSCKYLRCSWFLLFLNGVPEDFPSYQQCLALTCKFCFQDPFIDKFCAYFGSTHTKIRMISTSLIQFTGDFKFITVLQPGSTRWKFNESQQKTIQTASTKFVYFGDSHKNLERGHSHWGLSSTRLSIPPSLGDAP